MPLTPEQIKGRITHAHGEERRQHAITRLIHEAATLYNLHATGIISDEDYQTQGARIKADAAALGVRLRAYGRGTTCINLYTESMSNKYNE